MFDFLEEDPAEFADLFERPIDEKMDYDGDDSFEDFFNGFYSDM
jgi:hypothetical protein